MQEKKYGLFTTITMITGIVIGSGIFFKSDDILQYTNGNMLLGIAVFLIAAIAIIFGCLTVSQLASRSDKPGGMIAYAEEFVSKRTAGALGLFQIVFYFGTLVPVVAWVTGIYICQLFQLESTLFNQMMIGFVVMTALFVMNMVSSALGGYFQNAAMLIKLIPLVLFAVIGLIYGKPGTILVHDMETVKGLATSTGWLAAFAPIAFSYDGWIVATTIGHKIKDSKKNLPIALIVSPLIILACYILYFVGITSLLGTETILAQGNDSVFLAATKIFGGIGGKVILVFVIVSILGTLNGLILGFIQMPYSIAVSGLLPKSEWFVKKSEKLGNMPVNSAILTYVISTVWFIINYITQNANMPGDVSEVPVCFSYVSYIILYVVVIKLAIKGEIKNKFMGFFVPGMAIVGSLIILTGTLSHPLFFVYLGMSLAVFMLGYLYNKKKHTKTDI